MQSYHFIMKKHYILTANLNLELWAKFNEESSPFSYTTYGNHAVILFENHVLWDSEDDEREFYEDTNKYEPLKPFVKKKYNEWVEKLNKFKFSEEETKNRRT